MINFDVQAFLSLPSIGGEMEKDGKYCAAGKFNKVCGFEQDFSTIRNMIGESALSDIVSYNDRSVSAQEWKSFADKIRERESKYADNIEKSIRFKTRALRLTPPNPDKAARMLIEALRGKVNFINEGMVYEAPAQVEVAV